jgi:hypothetical protein
MNPVTTPPTASTWIGPKGSLTVVAETRRGPVKICELMPQATDHRDRAYHEEAQANIEGVLRIQEGDIPSLLDLERQAFFLPDSRRCSDSGQQSQNTGR